MRFPRTDDGWTEAWNRFTAWEPRAVEVPMGGVAPDLRFSGGEFRSGSTRANWTMWLLAIIALLTVIQFGFQSAELSLLSRVHRGEVVTREEADASDTRIQAITVIAGTVTIGLVVSWLMWQHRAHANLRALGASDLKYTPGWAVGWWFIPFAFFVVPFLTMRELWKASDPESGAVDWKLKPATPVLGVWWAGWLLRISVFPTLALSAAPGDHPPVAQLITRDRYLLAGDVVTLATAILAILLVRWINARLQAKHRRVSSWTRGFATAATA
jgi:hypothetical protein